MSRGHPGLATPQSRSLVEKRAAAHAHTRLVVRLHRARRRAEWRGAHENGSTLFASLENFHDDARSTSRPSESLFHLAERGAPWRATPAGPPATASATITRTPPARLLRRGVRVGGRGRRGGGRRVRPDERGDARDRPRHHVLGRGDVREGDRARGSRGAHARGRLLAHPRVSSRARVPRALCGALPPSRPSLPPPGSRPPARPRRRRPGRRGRRATPRRRPRAHRLRCETYHRPRLRRPGRGGRDRPPHLRRRPGPGTAPASARRRSLPRPGDPPDLVSPEDIGARILAHLKRAAEASLPSLRRRLGFAFGSLTVSVPVDFDAAQRAATAVAKRAGFRVARLLEEPVAAAIAYGVHEKALNGSMSSADGDRDGGRIVVVYDLGGGTLDVAVLRWETSARAFLVMATAGDPRLGGEDFDRALVGWLRDRLATEVTDASDGVTLGDDPASRETALRAMERGETNTRASRVGSRACRRVAGRRRRAANRR